MFLVHTAVSSHTSYTKADCCCFSELVSRRRRQVRLVCGGYSEILLTGATRGHWKERTGQKMQSWEAAGQDTERALLPAHSKNKLKSNRTCSSFLYKSKSYTDRCPRLEVWRLPGEPRKGQWYPENVLGHQEQQEGKHQAELGTTQMCTTDNLTHMFLLYTKATRKKGDERDCIKQISPRKYPHYTLHFTKAWADWMKRDPVLHSVGKQQEKRKNVFVRKQLQAQHIWGSHNKWQRTSDFLMWFYFLFLISSFKINWCEHFSK